MGGQYDTLKEPLVVTPGWSYVCFTDQKIKSDVWGIVKVPPQADSVRAAREIKILPEFFLEYDECLWMDASFQIVGNADEFIKKADGYDMMLMKHPERNTLYEEVNACIKLKKDSEYIIRNQYNDYKMYGNLPLAATGIIYRKNTEGNHVHNLLWASHVRLYSKRDQLSFGYAAMKSEVKFCLLNENIRDQNNKFFKLNKHN